jgi:hypothetical protein
MPRIMIHLVPGQDEQPVGWLATETGEEIAFTGWLHLIRLLEDELSRAPGEPGARPPSGVGPS